MSVTDHGDVNIRFSSHLLLRDDNLRGKGVLKNCSVLLFSHIIFSWPGAYSGRIELVRYVLLTQTF